MKRVYGYARSSTEEQDHTLQAQIARCMLEFQCRFQPDGFFWGGEFVDKGVSGSKEFRTRQAGFRLHQTVETGDVVIITKLDRGFRNCCDFVNVSEAWLKGGVRLLLLDMNVDTGTIVGRLMATILAGVAEFERERGRERTKEVLASRRAKGLPTGNPPYGYKNAGPRKRRKIEPDPYTREIGRRIVEWIDHQQNTFEVVFNHLQEHRVFRLDQKTEWSKTAIFRAYQGEKKLMALEAKGLSGQELLAAMLAEKDAK